MRNTYPRMSDLENATWHQMPVDGGQIVSITYTMADGYLYTSRHDRSDNSVSVTRAEVDESSETEFEPWNGTLPETTGNDEAVYADAVADMMEMLDRHGDRFAGNNVEDTAQDWIDNGFDADTAGDWCEIGMWDANTAAQCRDAGKTPSQIRTAAESLVDGLDDAAEKYTDGDPIYSVCNCDTNISVLLAEAE